MPPGVDNLPHPAGPAAPANEALAMATIRQALGEPASDVDKYRRGVVGVWAGSGDYPGAAVLACEAAARAGAGMLRYLPDADIARLLVLSRRPEVVTLAGPVDAWLVGCGIARLDPAGSELAAILASPTHVPVIADAGALYSDVLVALGDRLVLVTPHHGEAARLLGWSRARVAGEPHTAARAICREFGVAVLLKGAPSVLCVDGDDQKPVTLLPPGPGWLATAGTGDVLAGIAATLASAVRPLDLGDVAQAAALIHRTAAGLASRGGPLVALDVAERVSEAVRHVLERG